MESSTGLGGAAECALLHSNAAGHELCEGALDGTKVTGEAMTIMVMGYRPNKYQ